MNQNRYRELFDTVERTEKLTRMGDSPVGLNDRVAWDAFRRELSLIHEKERKRNAGAKLFDVALLSKALVLQQLNNLSDDRIEYLI